MIDNGIGISEEDGKKLFKDYFRSTDPISRARNASSHGLGLSICSKIAKSLDGKLSCISKLGEGSTFIFKFKAPVADDQETPSTTKKAKKNKNRRKKSKEID